MNSISITVPNYQEMDGAILYRVLLINTTGQYSSLKRYSELNMVHKSLNLLLHAQLPPFPKRHWFKSTNQSKQLIEERRAQLNEYFSAISKRNEIMESFILKNFFKEIQLDHQQKLLDQKHIKIHPSKKHKKATHKKLNKTPSVQAVNSDMFCIRRSNSAEYIKLPENREKDPQVKITCANTQLYLGLLKNNIQL